MILDSRDNHSAFPILSFSYNQKKRNEEHIYAANSLRDTDLSLTE